ncbi:MAG: thioesterase family protein [Candidatus Omnitrophota bacterium]
MKKSRLNLTFPIRVYPYRVYYADTDAGGVVYYAQYLRIFERMRALYVEEYGLTLREMAERNCVFVCRRAEVDYLSPALLDDKLEVKTWISELGGAYLTFQYEIVCPERTGEEGQPARIAAGITKMACCRRDESVMKTCRIPSWVLERLGDS